jgi:hypothetical protein
MFLSFHQPFFTVIVGLCVTSRPTFAYMNAQNISGVNCHIIREKLQPKLFHLLPVSSTVQLADFCRFFHQATRLNSLPTATFQVGCSQHPHSILRGGIRPGNLTVHKLADIAVSVSFPSSICCKITLQLDHIQSMNSIHSIYHFLFTKK